MNQILLSNITANTVGPVVPLGNPVSSPFHEFSFQSYGPFTATVQIKGSVDSALNAWSLIGDVSTPGNIISYLGPLFAVQAIVTSYTSGTIYVFMSYG